LTIKRKTVGKVIYKALYIILEDAASREEKHLSLGNKRAATPKTYSSSLVQS
jgi:hypothetical protein